MVRSNLVYSWTSKKSY